MEPIFKFLKDEEHRRLIALAELRTYRPGERLFSAGDEQTDIFMLIKGEVRLETSNADKTIEVSRCGSGEIIGQTFFLEGRAATLDHIAVTDVSALVISNAGVREQIIQDPGFGGRFYHSLAAMISRRLREISYLVTATKSADPPPSDSAATR